jgi:hypothetical protein
MKSNELLNTEIDAFIASAAKILSNAPMNMNIKFIATSTKH